MESSFFLILPNPGSNPQYPQAGFGVYFLECPDNALGGRLWMDRIGEGKELEVVKHLHLLSFLLRLLSEVGDPYEETNQVSNPISFLIIYPAVPFPLECHRNHGDLLVLPYPRGVKWSRSAGVSTVINRLSRPGRRHSSHPGWGDTAQPGVRPSGKTAGAKRLRCGFASLQ